MADQGEGKRRYGRLKKVALRGAGLALLVVAALYLLLNVLLNTPQATGRISRLLSETLHQPATVKGLSFIGGTIAVNGLTIGNPPGFTGGNLLTAGTVRVTPAWGALLSGRKSFSAITISDLKLTIANNSAGTWNFSGLTHISSGKKSASETFIKRLALERSAISVNGRELTDLSLSINDFSTKGSTGSGILLTFKDDYGSTYRLAGNARLGPHPDLDLDLAAPSVSFKVLQGLKLPLDPEKGGGKLSIKASLHGDKFKLGGNATVEKLTLRLKGEDVPLSAALDFAGQYDVKSDSAMLDRCVLQVDGVVHLRAEGKIDHLKKERAFTAAISYDGMEVNKIFALLPQKFRRDLLPGGAVLPGEFRIAGNGATGITSGHATFSLRHGRLGKGSRMLTDGVTADAVLDREKAGWIMRAKVSQQGKSAGMPVEFRDIPLMARFNERLRPEQAEIPSFTVRINGIPVKGGVAYRNAGTVPVTIRLDVKDAPLAVLAGSFPVKNMKIDKGSLTASVRASGSGPGEFRGDIVAGIRDLKGTYNGKKIALAGLSTKADAGAHNGKRTVSGSLKADGGLFDGKKLAASFAYRIADNLATLSAGDFSMERTRFWFAEISGPIPAKAATPAGNRVPVSLRFTGIKCRQDENGVDGLSGNLNAVLISAPAGRRLEGSGTITAQNLIYAGKGIGSLAGRFALAPGKGAADITGNVLDGKLAASISGDPFAGQREMAFTVNLAGVNGTRLTEVLGKARPVQVSGGTLAAAATGNYGARSGLRCRMDLTGGNLALTGKNGKTLISEGVIKLNAEFANGDLLVKGGNFSAGKGPVITLGGKIARAATAEREGEIDLVLAKVTLASLFDAFANILPRSLQEATAAGNVAAGGKMLIKGKQAAVAGEMTLEGASLEIPGQKLSIADINGVVPVSLDFSAAAAAKPPEKMSFSRENYPKLLPVMQQKAKGEHNLTIGKIRFGTTEFTTTMFAIRAGNGLTEISSLVSGLFQGALLGRGFFRYQGGLQFGADILVSDLSLREVCNSYPAIKGYLSGRVDGFVSLYGTDKGLNDIKGLVVLWTRSSKDEKMLVSKEFLQKLAGKNIRGMFFQADRPFDHGEIGAYLEQGFLTFETLDISHTNFVGIRDLSVSVAPVQNKISLDHLFTTIREAASRGNAATGGKAAPAEAPPATEFKWEE